MATDQPIPGRCGAKLSSGRGYCARYPVTGAKRCRQHYGERPPQSHGMLSSRLRWFAEHGAARVAEMVDDVHLLDPARSAAMMRLLVDEFTTIPTEEELLGYAQRLAGTNEDGTPQPVDIGHIVEARKHLAREARLTIEAYGRRQDKALQHQRHREAMVYYVTPVLERAARETMKIVALYVPADKQQQAEAALRHRMRAAMGEALNALQEAEGQVVKQLKERGDE